MVGPYDQFLGISRTWCYIERPNKWNKITIILRKGIEFKDNKENTLF